MLAERRGDRRPLLAYQAGGTQVIAAEGSLELRTVEEIERAAAAALGHDCGPVVLDLTAVSPSGDLETAALFGALRRLRRRGASIAIVGGHLFALGVFDAVALEGLTFTASVRDALTTLGQTPSPCGPLSPPPLSPERRAVRWQSMSPAPPPAPFSIAVESRPGAVRIAPRGEIDLAIAERLQREPERLVAAGLPRIVIDLRGVEFIGSPGLDALLAAHAPANATGGSWK